MANISLTNPQNIRKLVLNSSPKLGGNVSLNLFTKLVEFSGENNNLEQVTGSNNISTLEIYNVSYNLLTGQPENTWGITNLREYKINNNNFSGNIPSFISNSDIEIINVSNNSFTGELPFLGENNNLTHVHLQDNQLSAPPIVQIITISENVGMGTFSVGNIVRQVLPGGSTTIGSVAKITSSGGQINLYVINIQGVGLFGAGTNYSDLFTGTDPLGISYTYNITHSGGVLQIDGTPRAPLYLKRSRKYKFVFDITQPIRLSTTPDGTHGGGLQFIEGVTISGNELEIFVPANTPSVLYYYNPNIPNGGGKVNIGNADDGLGITASVPVSTVNSNPAAISSSIVYYNARNNLLSIQAVSDLLVSFDNAGNSNGTLYLDGTGNQTPFGGNTNPAYLSLISKGWTVLIN